jgi:hypothetical protein
VSEFLPEAFPIKPSDHPGINGDKGVVATDQEERIISASPVISGG